MLDGHCAGLYLDEITARSIGDYVQARRRGGATNATIRRDLTCLSRLLAFARARGWVDANVAASWDRSVIKERRDPITRPTPEAIDQVERAASPAFRRYLQFLLASGFRAEEAAGLLRRQVDWTTGIVQLDRTKTGRRTLDLAQHAPEAWAILKATPPALHSPYVFVPDAGGLRFTAPSPRFASARKSAQRAYPDLQAFRLHDLRHEFAIRWLEKGKPIHRLRDFLGHSSVKTTEIYEEHVTAEQAARARGETAQKPDRRTRST